MEEAWKKMRRGRIPATIKNSTLQGWAVVNENEWKIYGRDYRRGFVRASANPVSKACDINHDETKKNCKMQVIKNDKKLDN